MPSVKKKDGNSTKGLPWYALYHAITSEFRWQTWFLCHSLAKTFAKAANIDLKAQRTRKKRKCCIFWGWWKAGSDEVYQRKLVPSRVTPTPFSAGKCSASASGQLEVMKPALIWQWTSDNTIRHQGSEKTKHHYFCLLPGTGKVIRIADKIFWNYNTFSTNWEIQKHKENSFKLFGRK